MLASMRKSPNATVAAAGGFQAPLVVFSHKHRGSVCLRGTAARVYILQGIRSGVGARDSGFAWPGSNSEELTVNAQKCAHPNCSCQVTAGKYCSAACEGMAKTPDIDCRCGHPGCKGKAH
jgi:metallothionein